MHSLTAAIQVVLKYMLQSENCQVADGMYRQLLFKPTKATHTETVHGFKTQTNKQTNKQLKTNKKDLSVPLGKQMKT